MIVSVKFADLNKSMPIVKTFHDLNLSYTLWKIEENFGTLEELAILNLTEKSELRSIGNKKRRLEWIAARVALRQSVKNIDLIYFGTFKDKLGKPHLLDNDRKYSISMSHSAEFAIAAASKTHAIGIDIQKNVESLNTVRSKFLSTMESNYNELNILKLCVMWSAKEAIYKIFCSRINSLKDDILIQNFELKKQDAIAATISNNKIIKTVSVSYELWKDYVISYLSTDFL